MSVSSVSVSIYSTVDSAFIVYILQYIFSAVCVCRCVLNSHCGLTVNLSAGVDAEQQCSTHLKPLPCRLDKSNPQSWCQSKLSRLLCSF